MGQAVAVLFVAFMMVTADAVVFAWITDNHGGDVRGSDLSQPPAQATFFQCQVFGSDRNQLEMLYEMSLARREAPVLAALALIIHPGQQGKLGVSIQPQPGWGSRLGRRRRANDRVDGLGGT